MLNFDTIWRGICFQTNIHGYHNYFAEKPATVTGIRSYTYTILLSKSISKTNKDWRYILSRTGIRHIKIIHRRTELKPKSTNTIKNNLKISRSTSSCLLTQENHYEGRRTNEPVQLQIRFFFSKNWYSGFWAIGYFNLICSTRRRPLFTWNPNPHEVLSSRPDEPCFLTRLLLLPKLLSRLGFVMAVEFISILTKQNRNL